MTDQTTAARLPVPEGMTLVPTAALDWLHGLGDDFEQDRPGAFWWRGKFRELCAVPPAAQPPLDATGQGTGPNAYSAPEPATLEVRPATVCGELPGDSRPGPETDGAVRFAGLVLAAHRNDGYPGDVDGDDLQQMALDCGLIEERIVTEPCTPGCSCADVGDFPAICYFNTEAGRAAIAKGKAL